MAYHEQPDRLTPDQVTAFLALSTRMDLSPGPGGSRMTPVDVSATFPGSRSMFVALYPSAQLVAHRDPPITGTRVHYPLQVNDGCWVFHEGDWRQLEIGHGYAMDPTGLHGAVNWGSELRLHLMVDR